LAIEQPRPDVSSPNVIELDAPTEAELCTRGAVKLTHMQLTELRTAHILVQNELRAERQRNDLLTARMNLLQTDHQVLLASIQSTKYREIIVRIIELVILALLTYALDFEKSGRTNDFRPPSCMDVVCTYFAVHARMLHLPPQSEVIYGSRNRPARTALARLGKRMGIPATLAKGRTVLSCGRGACPHRSLYADIASFRAIWFRTTSASAAHILTVSSLYPLPVELVGHLQYSPQN
jgi:hypothetical protein